MKLVFLCKRRPMGRDLITRPYGRFFNLPRVLAQRGHEVHVALLSYRRESTVEFDCDGMQWSSDSALSGGTRYLSRVRALLKAVRPHWIVGCSDIYYGILAQRYARAFRVHSLIDAYDNYEGYIPWCKPLHLLWRRSLKEATAISAAGPALAALMSRGRPAGTTLVASMAADPIGFRPLPRKASRLLLGLPGDSRLVGYCGALYPNRGVDRLFKAFAHLQRMLPDTRLVLSGRLHKSVELPKNAVWLGYLPDEQMPALLNSLNVMAVVNRPSKFGAYSYPTKLYEAMKCSIPIVATITPATQSVLSKRPQQLADTENEEEFAFKLATAMKQERVDYGAQPTWEMVGAELDNFLLEIS